MAWQTAAGATLRIAAGAPATYDAQGYSALPFSEIGEVTNIGQFGKEFALVQHQPLSSRGVKKGKGSFNNGTLNPNLALDPEDDGQQLLEEALESDAAYTFEVELQNGTTYYFRGLVMSFRPNVGGSDEVVNVNPTIELTSDPIVRSVAN